MKITTYDTRYDDNRLPSLVKEKPATIHSLIM